MHNVFTIKARSVQQYNVEWRSTYQKSRLCECNRKPLQDIRPWLPVTRFIISDHCFWTARTTNTHYTPSNQCSLLKRVVIALRWLCGKQLNVHCTHSGCKPTTDILSDTRTAAADGGLVAILATVQPVCFYFFKPQATKADASRTGKSANPQAVNHSGLPTYPYLRKLQ